ncbi:unnamed protein product, partial [Oppiella nova]
MDASTAMSADTNPPKSELRRTVTTHALSPWSDRHELVTVFGSIYQNPDFVDIDYELLTFAKNKITIWLTRVHHNVDVAVHLMATREMINALIEDNRANQRLDEEDRDESAVYSLYCLAVIRFCTAISQYSHENNMKSVRRLAHKYSCPQWIIDCRHSLCHSSGTQPSIEELRSAALIGLHWMRQYFWEKVLDNNSAKRGVDCDYYALIERYISVENKAKKRTKSEIISAIKHTRNELVSAVVRHLIASESNGDKKLANESLKVPKMYLRKFANVFAIIISYQSLPLLLNQLVTHIDSDNRTQRHLAMSWFATLIRTIGSDNKVSKFKRHFQRLSYGSVMARIEWVRLLYAVVKRPNGRTSALIQLMAPIVADVVSEDKIEVLMNLAMRYSYESIETINENNDQNSGDKGFVAKTVMDLLPENQINDSEANS